MICGCNTHINSEHTTGTHCLILWRARASCIFYFHPHTYILTNIRKSSIRTRRIMHIAQACICNYMYTHTLTISHKIQLITLFSFCTHYKEADMQCKHFSDSEWDCLHLFFWYALVRVGNDGSRDAACESQPENEAHRARCRAPCGIEWFDRIPHAATKKNKNRIGLFIKNTQTHQ